MAKSENLINSYMNDIMAGIRPGWRRILMNSKLKPYLIKSFSQLNTYLLTHGVNKVQLSEMGLAEFIRPTGEHIFESMKYFDPQNLKVILIGQDPYLKKEEAHGLSFSVPKGIAIPKSLNNIYKSLVSQGFIDTVPEHGCLVNWAKQGVLLLNRYLTRSPKIKYKDGFVWIEGLGGDDPKCTHNFWSEFTTKLVDYLTNDFISEGLNHPRHHLYVMLWGEKAKELTGIINYTGQIVQCEGRVDTSAGPGKIISVLQWGHPSPSSPINNDTNNPNNFLYCDNFSAVPINWDPDYDPGDELLDQFYHLKLDLQGKFDIQEWIKDKSLDTIYDDGSKSIESKYITKVKQNSKSNRNQLGQLNVALLTAETPTQEILIDNPYVIGVDGGCRNNGKTTAIASYGIYFPVTFNGMKNAARSRSIGGTIPTKATIAINNKLELVTEDNPRIKATNGRAELMAVLCGLIEAVKELKNIGPRTVIIILDADYSRKLIEERIWKAAPSNFAGIELNKDLIICIYTALIELAKLVKNYRVDKSFDPYNILIADHAYCGNELVGTWKYGSSENIWGGLITFHQDSHQPSPVTQTLEKDIWLCNNKADDICNKILDRHAMFDHNPHELK